MPHPAHAHQPGHQPDREAPSPRTVEVLRVVRPMTAILCAVVMMVCLLGLVSSPGPATARTVAVLVVASIVQVALIRTEIRARRSSETVSVNQAVERRPGQIGIDQHQR